MPWALVRLALSSTARLSVVPAQDLLGLGSEARMNTPGTDEGNWALAGTRRVRSTTSSRLSCATWCCRPLAPEVVRRLAGGAVAVGCPLAAEVAPRPAVLDLEDQRHPGRPQRAGRGAVRERVRWRVVTG